MKIYFYDGELPYEPMSRENIIITIDAKYGHKACVRLVNLYRGRNDVSVLTNYTYLLNSFGWNEQENKWDVWIWQEKSMQWKNVQDLTDRELRQAHNLERLYRAGEFDEEDK